MKLIPFIISLCPKPKSYLTKIFAHSTLIPYFELPTFTLEILSRDLRNSYKLIQQAEKYDILTSDKLIV